MPKIDYTQFDIISTYRSWTLSFWMILTTLWWTNRCQCTANILLLAIQYNTRIKCKYKNKNKQHM